MPLRAADSAVTCAANGVDLREPLNPTVPADSQAITLPERSVMVTIVLLKLALMWAWPNGTFFFTLRRPERPFLASAVTPTFVTSQKMRSSSFVTQSTKSSPLKVTFAASVHRTSSD